MDQKRARPTPSSRLAEAEPTLWTPASGRAPIAYHLTARLTDNRVIAATPAERRELARVVYEQGEARGLVAFGAADDHLHAIAACDRMTAGDLARFLLISLRWRLQLAAEFEPCRLRPIHDQRHLDNGVRYVFRQEERHGIASDPFHDASSLADLAGLRVLGPETRARVKKLLPRLDVGTLGLVVPAGSVAVSQHLLADATLSAAGLVHFEHNAASKVARCAAVHALAAPSPIVAALLGVTDRTVRRLREARPDQELLRAIKRQLAIRSAAPEVSPDQP